MIQSFYHKGLKTLFLTGKCTNIDASLHRMCLNRLDALDHIKNLNELNIPGFNFHVLQGKPKRYSIHVNGPWCITFEWIDGDVWRVDLVQYN